MRSRLAVVFAVNQLPLKMRSIYLIVAIQCGIQSLLIGQIVGKKQTDSANRSSQLNVVFVLCDDHRYDCLG
ncbi:MAG: hypothetical protein ACPHL6_09425, partial [Rubripirellula sp.]